MFFTCALFAFPILLLLNGILLLFPFGSLQLILNIYSGDLSFISFFDFFHCDLPYPHSRIIWTRGEFLCQLSDIFGLGPGSADTLRPKCFCALLPGIGQLCRAHPSLKTNYLVIHTVNTVCKYLPQDTTFGNVWYFFTCQKENVIKQQEWAPTRLCSVYS